MFYLPNHQSQSHKYSNNLIPSIIGISLNVTIKLIAIDTTTTNRSGQFLNLTGVVCLCSWITQLELVVQYTLSHRHLDSLYHSKMLLLSWSSRLQGWLMIVALIDVWYRWSCWSCFSLQFYCTSTKFENHVQTCYSWSFFIVFIVVMHWVVAKARWWYLTCQSLFIIDISIRNCIPLDDCIDRTESDWIVQLYFNFNQYMCCTGKHN